MKKILIAAAFLATAGAALALETVTTPDQAKQCEKLGKVSVGDMFLRMDKESLMAALRDDAKKLGADKISVNVVAHKHPKLGTDYSGTAIAWKCDK